MIEIHQGKRIHLFDETKILSACRVSDAVYVYMIGGEGTKFTGAEEELNDIFAGIRTAMKHRSDIHVTVKGKK